MLPSNYATVRAGSTYAAVAAADRHAKPFAD